MNRYRRRFLKAAAAGGLAYAFGRTPGTVSAQMSALNGYSDYRALVCLFLFGGNDSWNMLIPNTESEYAAYARSRGAGTSSSLAIDRSMLLPISSAYSQSQSGAFGFHPSMPEIRDLFNAGNLAIVPNVGPLVRPTTKWQYQNAVAINHELPPQLFSHNDQQDQWHSLRGRRLLRTGWAGRIADVLGAQLGNQQIPLNISLFGQTFFQAGERADPYVMGAGGVNMFEGLTYNEFERARRSRVESVLRATLDSTSNSYYERGFARVQERALRYADRLNAAIANAYSFSAFPSGRRSVLTTQLRTVARMISARDSLSMSRQIFFVAAGGFDQHDRQMDEQPDLLADVSRSISAFQSAMVELGISDKVTLFTQSDFGRTLTSNGDGSDHAWGGTQLVVGGAVVGGRLYGDYPLLEMDGPLEVGSGSFIPTVSSDQYATTLARWFGVSAENLSDIAPNIVNFPDWDLGFMG